MEEDTKLDIQKSINQVRDIIELLEANVKIKLPKKVNDFFTHQYDEKVEYLKLQTGKPLKSQKMEKYTAEIITDLFDKYIK